MNPLRGTGGREAFNELRPILALIAFDHTQSLSMIAIARHCLITGCLIGSALHAQATHPMLQCARVEEFVAIDGRDTIARSHVMLSDSTFESSTHAISQGALIRHTGRLSAAGLPRTLHFEVWPPGADSAGPPAQIADITVQGTDVTARVAAPTRGVQVQHDRLPPGGVLYMSGPPLFLEFLQRQVHVAVGATTTVPVLWLFTGGVVDTVQVTRPASDSLIVRFPDTEYALALAPDRSILGALSHSRKDTAESPVRLVRRDCR